MFTLSCRPSTFLLSFGKGQTHLSNALINAIHDFLDDPDSYSIKCVYPELLKELSAVLCDLKFSPRTAWTPRCTVHLSTLYDLIDIVNEYGYKNDSSDCIILKGLIKQAYDAMKDVKY